MRGWGIAGRLSAPGPGRPGTFTPRPSPHWRDRHPACGAVEAGGRVPDADLDLVVTVCDLAAEECPIWVGKGKRRHYSFPDPAKAEGTDEQIMDVFRAVRDDIEKEMVRLLNET